jgi:Ca-activated chloride channel family protein
LVSVLLTSQVAAQTYGQTTPQAPSKVTPQVPDKSTPVPDKAAEAEVQPPPPKPGGEPIEILVLYGSEKRGWLEQVTPRFNTSGAQTTTGRPIRVVIESAGSGQMMTDVIEGKKRAHVLSPAANAFVLIGNETSREQGGQDLLHPTVNLVGSPVVVMIWKDLADELTKNGPVRWADLFGYARDPAKWKTAAPSASGPFRLGHTEADSSNSGLHSLFLEVMAAAGKTQGLTLVDVGSTPVKQYVRQVEAAVPYYEASTGDLAKRMVREGPGALTAAIVYENSVIEANRQTAASGQPPRVVAIYPAEGTYPTEHPIGVVNRPYVTPEHVEAANAYINFLRARPQQEEAKRFGFRPSDPSILIDDLLTSVFGVADVRPTPLSAPRPSVINAIRQLWRDNKNPNAPAPSH